MRIPYIIHSNTLAAYTPSTESKHLLGERKRKIISENFAWNENSIRPLTDFAVEIISRHYEKLTLLDELPCENKAYLLEILSVDLPIECVVPNIENEFYWRRRYESHFGLITRRKPPDWTWKSIYLERHVGKLIEEAEPQYADEEGMDDMLTLCHAYVKRLIITQLQSWKPPLTMQKEDIPEVYPLDHINFTYVCNKLPNVTEFDLIYGMNVNMDSFENFNWNMFKISVNDCKKLGKALLDFKQLKLFRLHKSRLEYKHCQALMKGLIKNTSLIEVDLSHCEIGDKGALCVAKLLEVHPTLEVLNLSNNGIGQIGAEGIGFILVTSTSTKLKSLILRLNPLFHSGTMGILRAIVRCELPLELNLSGCQFEEETPERISQMLKLNKTLKKLDISNNWFGEEGGEFLVNALDGNSTLEWLDIRETDITSDQEKTIKQLLARNRGKIADGSEEDNEEQEEGVVGERNEVPSEKVDEKRASHAMEDHDKSNVDV